MSDHQAIHTNKSSSARILSLYVVGYILSAILTVIAFVFVMNKWVTSDVIYLILAVFGLLQLLIQVKCFIRVNSGEDRGGWNLMSLLFTVLVVIILVCGSLWIMYNLNYNMTSH